MGPRGHGWGRCSFRGPSWGPPNGSVRLQFDRSSIQVRLKFDSSSAQVRLQFGSKVDSNRMTFDAASTHERADCLQA
eukprot:8587917-Pyramimonas_sp.AAC.1